MGTGFVLDLGKCEVVLFRGLFGVIFPFSKRASQRESSVIDAVQSLGVW